MRHSLAVLLFLSCLLSARALEPATAPSAARPMPGLKASDVVKIQIDALRQNDEKNSGIETCFRFASPDNQKQTGPVERFALIVKTPPYDKLTGFTEARFTPIKTAEDGRMTQLVVLKAADGTTAGFVFVLSKQTDGEYKDCWMTDAVVPLAPAGKEADKPV